MGEDGVIGLEMLRLGRECSPIFLHSRTILMITCCDIFNIERDAA